MLVAVFNERLLFAFHIKLYILRVPLPLPHPNSSRNFDFFMALSQIGSKPIASVYEQKLNICSYKTSYLAPTKIALACYVGRNSKLTFLFT